jgi:U2-associated protein SR140
MNFEMKLGWGKAVPIPAHPVYIPPKLLELTLPPPASGLPFNAQPDAKDVGKLPAPGTAMSTMMQSEPAVFEELVRNSIVKVIPPTDRSLLSLIHRMVEFVVKEGPMFEAMIMNREIANPMFRFLFDNQSPAHIYYRWRLFAVLQGEHHSKWNTEPFRMFRGGSLWKPPPISMFTQGMPDELIERSPGQTADDEPNTPVHSHSTSASGSRGFRESKESKKGTLSEKQRERLEDILRNLTPERCKVQESMIFCIEHSDAAEEVVACITESLMLDETPLHRKIARLYLVSDILHNCTAKVANVSYFRKGFQATLTEIFKSIHKCYESIEGRLKAEHFKQRVMNCFKAWEDWALYSSDFLIRLQNIFLGLVKEIEDTKQNELILTSSKLTEDIDGLPIKGDEDAIEAEEDIDGVPIQNATELNYESAALKFKPSKWETIDPQLIEKQAMTSSKWDELDESDGNTTDRSKMRHSSQDHEEDEDIDGVPIDEGVETDKNAVIIEQLKQQLQLKDEERRSKLREIELAVVKYQDDLETRSPKDTTIAEKVNEYRIRLLRKCIDNQRKRNGSSVGHRSRSRSSSPSTHYNRKRSHSRSPSRTARRR